jgi:hypothetical protein
MDHDAIRNEMQAEIDRLRADYLRICRGHDQLHNERDDARAEIKRLRTALKPFADIADLVNHTDRRDGERVYELPRKPGGAGYFTLVREDFRRAARAYGPVDPRITQPKPLGDEQIALHKKNPRREGRGRSKGT